MLVDHIGAILFPDAIVLRCIGRLSFPIFAFMISEGAKYTKNRLRYILGISLLALLCQIVYYFYGDRSLYMSILVTFSLSIVIIFSMQGFKRALFSDDVSSALPELLLFAGTVLLAYLFTCVFSVDYGFIGVLIPVFASIFDFSGISVPENLKKLDNIYVRILCLGIGLLIFSTVSLPVQYFSLLAIPLLLLYSEKRGRLRLKNFFYLFYPLHLLVLEGIAILLKS